MNISELNGFLAGLSVGDTVQVRWGYGSGFRAEGKGKIVKMYPKSVQVELLEPVSMIGKLAPGPDWSAGFVLKGVPRNLYAGNWSWEYCVLPLDYGR